MQKDNYDYLFKYIIIGNSSCGKTCLFHHFLEGKFKTNSTYTIGVEFGSKQIDIEKKKIKLQIWDTAGQERFKSVARTYYRGALGAVIVFDVTSMDSFLAVPQWIKDARDLAREDISIMVCANKCDLKENRVVQNAEIQQMCQENNVNFLETSAISGQNVQEGFTTIAKKILEQMQRGEIDPVDTKPGMRVGPVPDKDKTQQKQNCMGVC